jgi:hypothetical protein
MSSAAGLGFAWHFKASVKLRAISRSAAGDLATETPLTAIAIANPMKIEWYVFRDVIEPAPIRL